MAQVDFANYFSILFWFFILFISFYVINYSYIIPSIYSIIYIRYSYYIAEYYQVRNKFNFYPKYKNTVSSTEGNTLSTLNFKISILHGNF